MINYFKKQHERYKKLSNKSKLLYWLWWFGGIITFGIIQAPIIEEGDK